MEEQKQSPVTLRDIKSQGRLKITSGGQKPRKVGVPFPKF